MALGQVAGSKSRFQQDEQEVSLPLEAVLEALKAAGHEDEELPTFTRLFLAQMQDAEFEDLTADGLATLVHMAWDLIVERASNTHKIRAFDRPDDPLSPGGIMVVEMINDDMPFLLDSVLAELQAQGLEVYRVLHPALHVSRDDNGRILSLREHGLGQGEAYKAESLIQIHTARVTEDGAKKALCERLSVILDNVRIAVTDWQRMMDSLRGSIITYGQLQGSSASGDFVESVEFLNWLSDNNFTFLGMRRYSFSGSAEKGELTMVPDSGLGILRDESVLVLRRGTEMVDMTPEIRKFFLSPDPLIITKANMVSTVHRRTHMDYIGVKEFNAAGEITGELRIVGLFTSTAYTRSVTKIPFLRRKAAFVLERAGFAAGSHSGKALLNILETFPRDELFQITPDMLYKFVTGIHSLDFRPRARAFARVDEFDRFVSVLVYVPRDRYSTDVRMKIGDYLADIYKGRVSAFFPTFASGPLVRIHFIIGRYEGETPQPAMKKVNSRLRQIVRTWEDGLREDLQAQNPNGEAAGLARKYAGAFSAGYEETFSTSRATEDIRRFEHLSEDTPVAVDFYRQEGAEPGQVRVALYHLFGPIPLSRRVPILENLGFSVIDERTYSVKPDMNGEIRKVSLHDMVLKTRDDEPIELDECAERLEKCFLAVWHGETGNDDYNVLVLKAGLDWREAEILRAFGAYLRQISVPFGQRYLSRTLIAHSGIAVQLIELFRTRFALDENGAMAGGKRDEAEIVKEIEAAFEAIPSLDEDRILRHFLNLAQAASRTNFYQRDRSKSSDSLLAFKFDSKTIDGAPDPKPFAEIFVFSERVEGVHLRGGPVARGGLRWSDRPQDFRSEVLGLAKAQQVKNAVIVPSGSKGGFVPKRMPANPSREEFMAEGTACYKLFVSSLLTVTDNLEGQDIVPPEGVRRHDGDDPYLVVAADKGTATFSDIANEISQAHGFWLDDAFASGGSAGYDHKKMGITARGGWEAVKRHFRETDVDIQATPFTVIGVGDMSGDVFGNGMLLSEQTRLLVAFDHRDIFIDPDPDPAASFEERTRLFNLGRSSWQDYDTSLISEGGGVFSRSAKKIELNDTIRAMTGLKQNKIAPSELIRALLKSKADLLWFGGIGTYVRATSESDLDAGDRANDALRIRADELNVKAIGEGANLGLTHRARIEFALSGGRVNTDAIDNSAGVNSSDLEVNIKITLGAAMKAGKLDRPARNVVLEEMTEEVADRCLRNNYLQTLALSLGERRGLADLGFQQRLMRDLESSGLLNRDLEYLPSDSQILERRKETQPLTRPELAVLLAYAKIDLFDKLVDSDVPDDGYLESELMNYFPKSLRENYPDEIRGHRLSREIIATRLANAVINRGGSTMVVRLKEETGHSAAAVVRAFIITRAVFELQILYDGIDDLDNKVSGEKQLKLYQELQDVVRQRSLWFLRHVKLEEDLQETIDLYRSGQKTYFNVLDGVLNDKQRGEMDERIGVYEQLGLDGELARSMTRLHAGGDLPDIVLVSKRVGRSVEDIAGVYCAAGDYFRFSELRQAATQLATTDYYDRLAINSTLDMLSSAERAITHSIVKLAGGGALSFDAWRDANEQDTERTRKGLDEMLDSGALTLSKFTVAVSQLRSLAPA